MKKVFAVLLATAVLAMTVLSAMPLVDAAEDEIVISGIVLDDLGSPLDEVKVTVETLGGNLLPYTFGPSGVFSISIFADTEDPETYPKQIKFEKTDGTTSFYVHMTTLTPMSLDDPNWYALNVKVSTNIGVVVMSEIDHTAEFTLSGTILYSADGKTMLEPLKDVRVVIQGSGGPEFLDTGADGKFSIKLPAFTTYTLTFNIDLYDVDNVVGLTKKADGYGIYLKNDTDTQIIMMPAAGTVSGKITDPQGRALGGVLIELRPPGGEGKVYSASTGNDGNYTIVAPKGTYIISADRGGYEYDNPGGPQYISVERDEITYENFVLKMVLDVYLFGLDLPHSLMIGGVGLGVIMILMMIVYKFKPKTAAGPTVTISDDTMPESEIVFEEIPEDDGSEL